jgi:hypothetical protein
VYTLLIYAKTLISVLICSAATAQADCVLQDKTVSQSSVTISERTQLTATVVPEPTGGKRCLVTFRARVGPTWYTATGEYTWSGDTPRDSACAVAVKRAEDSVRDQVSSSRVISEKILVCNDDTTLETIRQTNPGTVGDLAQFRPHPGYPKEFWYNGTRCRWFLDTGFTGRDVKTWQGIICLIHDSKWVVVDKF